MLNATNAMGNTVKNHWSERKYQFWRINRNINVLVDAGSKTIPGTPSRPRLLGCAGPVRRSICGLAHTRALEHLIKIVRWAREELARARAFTQYNKRVSKLKSNIGTLIDKDGVLQTDPKIMADLLQHQYTSVFSDPNCHLKKSPLLKLKHPAAC